MLVNNAGGALGARRRPPQTDVADWRGMFETNVIGTLQVTQALLPALIASGAGTIVNVGSIAGRLVYEGGGGYTAAKHARRRADRDAAARARRPAGAGHGDRAGDGATEEFSLTRFGGDQERADTVYAGVAEPLVAEDIADAIGWMVDPAGPRQHRPARHQAARPGRAHKVHRES